MNQLIKLPLLFILAVSIAACEPAPPNFIRPDHHYLSYQGRTDPRPDGIALITSAASVSIHLSGENCTVYLKNEAPAGQYNYAAFELNGEYHGRYMLSSVSGIGVYRNWNSDGPTMPDVYKNTYLNTDTTKVWKFSSTARGFTRILIIKNPR